MTIRFRVAPGGTERVAFAYSALLEAVLSLHALVEPEHHAVHHPWVRWARGLPVGLKREIGAFSFAFRRYVPEFLFPDPAGHPGAFQTDLGSLASLPEELVAVEFTRPLRGERVTRDPAALRRPAARAAIRRAARALGGRAERLALLGLEAPGELMGRFQQLLRDYWEAGFEEEWARIEPRLARDVEEAGRTISDRGLYGMLEELLPEVHSDRAKAAFWVERAHQHDVEIGENERLVLVPSVYAWPHVEVNCDAPWPLGLVFPGQSIRREAQPSRPPGDLLRILRALADDTRLRTLHLVAERPRSTQELASLVRVSTPAMSGHLRVLSDAGIVRKQREGYYVLYALAPDRLRDLAPTLTAFLEEAR